MYEVYKALLLPPVSLILLAIVGFAYRRGRSRVGRLVAGMAVVLLLLMSVPAVSERMLATLERDPPLPADGPFPAAQAIVILSASAEPGPEFGGLSLDALTLERVRYGAWLQRRTQAPVLVSGGDSTTNMAGLMRDVLTREFATPVEWVEDNSRNTDENAIRSAAILRAAGKDRIFLVTSAWHMKRARLAFEHEGVTVIPAPTGFVDLAGRNVRAVIPNVEAMRMSYFVLHEWIGIATYKLWSR